MRKLLNTMFSLIIATTIAILAVPPIALSGKDFGLGSQFTDFVGSLNMQLQKKIFDTSNAGINGPILYWKFWCLKMERCLWVGDILEKDILYNVYVEH